MRTVSSWWLFNNFTSWQCRPKCVYLEVSPIDFQASCIGLQPSITSCTVSWKVHLRLAGFNVWKSCPMAVGDYSSCQRLAGIAFLSGVLFYFEKLVLISGKWLLYFQSACWIQSARMVVTIGSCYLLGLGSWRTWWILNYWTLFHWLYKGGNWDRFPGDPLHETLWAWILTWSLWG